MDELGAFHRETAWIDADVDNDTINEIIIISRVDAIGMAVGESERQTLPLLLFRLFIMVTTSIVLYANGLVVVVCVDSCCCLLLRAACCNVLRARRRQKTADLSVDGADLSRLSVDLLANFQLETKNY